MLISAQEMSIFVSCLGIWLFMQMGSSNQSSIGGQCFLWWIVVACLHSNQCIFFVHDSEVSNAKISYWQDKGKLAIAQKGIH